MTEQRKRMGKSMLACVLGLWAAAASSANVTTADGAEVPDIGPLPPVEANPENVPTEARLAQGTFIGEELQTVLAQQTLQRFARRVCTGSPPLPSSC
jgi:hypothetical protein